MNEHGGSATSLTSVDLRRRYNSGRNDLLAEFFQPCLAAAISYDRAVGFFSSSFYALVGVDLAAFVRRGGRMRLVCCPRLSALDIDAIRDGYSERVTGASLLREIDDCLEDAVGEKVTKLLATLITGCYLEVQIAFRRNSARIYHDKLGIFKDRDGNRVTFDGSTNESWSGWSEAGNYEGFHAFASWADPDRVLDDVGYFESLWGGDEPGLEVRPFPQVARERLQALADPEGVEHAQLRVRDAIEVRAAQVAHGRDPLRRHQRMVLNDWSSGAHRGIVEHATGSGKTLTALAASEQALAAGQALLIATPAVLLDQWRDVATRFFGEDCQILLVGGGHSEWRRAAALRNFLEPGFKHVLLASIDTVATPDFMDRVKDVHPLCLVVDEVHRVGSPERRRLFEEIDADWRLALSATWEREGDPVGTAAILSYFERVLQPIYTIKDALADGYLSEYRYIVHSLALSGEERTEWQRHTAAVAQAMGATNGELTENVRQLLIRRARVVKKADAKVPIAVEVLRQEYREDDAWLVYCDDTDQLTRLRGALLNQGIRSLEYHRQVVGAEEEALAEFQRSGGIMLAIRCLDEGIDIPRIDHALVLASSTTKREFIQRRGRILRRADRKYIAEIHDLIVDASGFEADADVSFMRNELERAREFASLAKDSIAARELLERWERELLAREEARSREHEQDLGPGVEDDDYEHE